MEDILELVLETEFERPEQLWLDLTRLTEIRALQCGEWGPFRQVLAGLDTAVHDLCARRRGLPLADTLSENVSKAVPYYASGLQVSTAHPIIEALRGEGVFAFKVKVGFDEQRDLADLAAIANDLGVEERLFADANQAWNLDAALRFVEASREFGLGWIEEPIRADRPIEEWKKLAARTGIPIAAGENIAGEEAFASAIASGVFTYLQPDVAKWGGVTGNLKVARKARSAGLTYCPHFLGGGIGLLASAHILAAAGGKGLLEVDANANPLRDAFLEENKLSNGSYGLAAKSGLGIEALPDSIAPYRTLYLDSTQ
jgi:L-alanine-DL-glutamate epimerase-like enolase superfamily enzyme